MPTTTRAGDRRARGGRRRRRSRCTGRGPDRPGGSSAAARAASTSVWARGTYTPGPIGEPATGERRRADDPRQRRRPPRAGRSTRPASSGRARRRAVRPLPRAAATQPAAASRRDDGRVAHTSNTASMTSSTHAARPTATTSRRPHAATVRPVPVRRARTSPPSPARRRSPGRRSRTRHRGRRRPRARAARAPATPSAGSPPARARRASRRAPSCGRGGGWNSRAIAMTAATRPTARRPAGRLTPRASKSGSPRTAASDDDHGADRRADARPSVARSGGAAGRGTAMPIGQRVEQRPAAPLPTATPTAPGGPATASSRRSPSCAGGPRSRAAGRPCA